MNKLIEQLQRLYFLTEPQWQCVAPASGAGTDGHTLAQCLAGACRADLDLLSAQGLCRTLVVAVERGSDWPQVAALYQGVQEDFDLPLPALAVAVEAGYQVWFSLAEPVPLSMARAFLDGLRRKYLGAIPASRLRLYPAAADARVALAPALQPASGRWSAFIDPTMGGMFVEATWLDMAPNPERQADMLVALRSIPAREFARVCGELQAAGSAAAVPASVLTSGPCAGPKAFLLAVMNDPALRIEQRIEAAKALLPYCEQLGE